ncbi:MAG: hypothetical protein ABIH41_03125 [Nanoarchaeota archaeon]
MKYDEAYASVRPWYLLFLRLSIAGLLGYILGGLGFLGGDTPRAIGGTISLIGLLLVSHAIPAWVIIMDIIYAKSRMIRLGLLTPPTRGIIAATKLIILNVVAAVLLILGYWMLTHMNIPGN